MLLGQSVTKSKLSLQGRLASFPPMLFSYHTLPIAYGEYLVNSDQALDVVELLSGFESMACVARTALLAGHEGHQHLQADGFDTRRPLCITDQKGQGCEYITCVEGFRYAL